MFGLTFHTVSTAIVVFLRLLTSAQIRMDPDSFDAFLFHPDFGNQMTARDFCETFVEPTGKEAGAILPHLSLNVRGSMSMQTMYK